MTFFTLTRPGGPWDYATLGFIATNGAVLNGATLGTGLTIPPDAFWAVGGSSESGITRYAQPSVAALNPVPEVTDGWFLAYDTTVNGYVPQDPADLILTDAWADPLAASIAERMAVLFVDDFAGANDQIKINAAVTAAYALADAGTAHVVLQFQPREYVLPDAPSSPDGDPGPYAQIPLPIRSSSETRLVIEFRGTATIPVNPDSAFSSVQVGGTVLRSTQNTVHSGPFGIASVIGGPTVDGGSTTFSNVAVVLDGICIRRVTNPKMIGADFSWVAQATTRNVRFDINATIGALVAAAAPSNLSGIAIHMPLVSNNGISCMEGTTDIFGSPVGIRFSEHLNAHYLRIALCTVALAPTPHFHGSVIHHAGIEWNKYVIADVSAASNTVVDCIDSGAEGGILHFGMLAIEDATATYGPNFVPVVHILDGDDVLHMTGRFTRVIAGVGTTTGLTITGGAHVDLHDMMVDETGGGGGASTIVRATRTAGSVNLNAGAGVWANVHTGLDLVIAAAAGDVVELGVSLCLGGENVAVHFDFWTIVSGSPLNRLAGEDGVPGWYSIPAVNATPSGTFPYTVQAGDIAGGNVTFRLRFKEASQTDRTLFAVADFPAYVWVKNPA